MSFYYRFFLIALLALSGCSSQKVNFTLLQLNDVYEISPINGGKTGGLARVATIQKQLKAENQQTYSILAGDFLSPSAIGTSLYNGERLAGKQMVAIFNHLHWDYITFGNHEFDIGKKALLQRLAESKSVFFSSNVRDKATQQPFANTQNTTVFTVDGVKVGLIGLTLEHTPLDFVTFLDPLAAAKKAVQELKQQQVDVIVLVTHQEFSSDIEMAEKLEGVDLILGGHEHENLHFVRGAKLVPIAKADANAKSVFVHRISVDKQTKSKQIDSKLVFLDESVALDEETTAVVNHWQEQGFAAFRKQGFEPEKVICTTSVALDGLEASVRDKKTVLTDLIAQAMLHSYSQADLALYNAGSIRLDDVLPAGEITEYDIIKILPFGGQLSLVQMSGEVLQRVFNAGQKNKGLGGFLHYANAVEKQGKWFIKEQALDLKRAYKVVIPDYLLDTGDKGLELLLLQGNSALKRIEAGKVEVRRVLIQELMTKNCVIGENV